MGPKDREELKIMKKERLIVDKLRKFINDDKSCPIAILAGMRHVGKTTVLEQLCRENPNSIIIDFSKNVIREKDLLYKFIKNPNASIIFLDEISCLPDYESECHNIFNIIGEETTWKFKVVITGSSPAHLINLANGKLGGRRGKLFFLPPITFVEYLYFTNKIKDYSDYSKASIENFKDYLQLKGVPMGMDLTFDEDYFINYYDVNNASNQSSVTSRAQNKLQKEDLINFANLLAYQLAEVVSYDKIIRPEIGNEELRNELLPSEIKALDFSNTIMFSSIQAVKSLSHEERSRLIEFLLMSRVANVETTLLNVNDRQYSEYEVNQLLQVTANHEDLQDFFSKVSIAVGSPLMYSRLGDDILQVAGLTQDILWENPHNNALLGKMVEVYVRGAMAHLENPLAAFSSIKLKYNGEVDVYKPNFRTKVMCETTIERVKPLETINLLKYFPDKKIIRVSSTRTHSDDSYGFHRIPYPLLCCMMDTGDILNLLPSDISDVGRSLRKNQKEKLARKTHEQDD